ncbi:carbohydrate esterase family 8 protein [Aulographum hederae CBS 113979]|uniref:Pectinesterase n=1 Tax=Aulographum hederae CBS 113979 TaxID=1176131 RepID=A0A6G1H864_9PEZI|nr:carbohydrate esterase family 8 protein [Aulographum hederae CBS 113979]
MRLLAPLLALLPAVIAQGLSAAPTGALTVGGPSGKYKTIASAIKALSKTSTAAQTIFINPGTYNEQLNIPKLASPLKIYGSSTAPTDFSKNTVTIRAGHSQEEDISNDETATLGVHTNDFALYNVNLVNTFGKGSQALALSAMGERQGYYQCSFKGYQDTVMPQTGSQVFVGGYIEGATDFIFGQQARSWFEGVKIGVLEGKGWVTAAGRPTRSSPQNYVFNNSSIAAAPGQSVAAGSYYLGRPWRNYARVTFQYCQMSAVVNKAGWSKWNNDEPRTDGVEFREFMNTGEGAAREGRVGFSKQAEGKVEVETVLGAGWEEWIDGTFMGA